MLATTCPRDGSRRRASLTVELLLLAPVLLMVVAGAVQLSLLVVVSQKLDAASAAGARVAAQGGDREAVREAVSEALHRANISSAEVAASLVDKHGQPLPPGATVEVIVSASAGETVPDLLGFVGFSVKDVKLTGRTLLRKE